MEEFTIEVLKDGEVQPFVLDLTDSNPEDACRRARSAIFIMKLREGEDWPLDSIETRVLA